MAVASGPFCGALGCTKDADVIIQNRYGKRYACDDHSNDGEVIGRV
ncbi:hypothetical protein [Halorubrum trueperi]|uniref:Uncharacterized protein n=1 Tax=Halorubrum trueperi TaxID=2004704 RepID=A0ABD5UJI6_9EURY